jgi:hypothetical protein
MPNEQKKRYSGCSIDVDKGRLRFASGSERPTASCGTSRI